MLIRAKLQVTDLRGVLTRYRLGAVFIAYALIGARALDVSW
jgi:hypothetical protein